MFFYGMIKSFGKIIQNLATLDFLNGLYVDSVDNNDAELVGGSSLSFSEVNSRINFTPDFHDLNNDFTYVYNYNSAVNGQAFTFFRDSIESLEFLAYVTEGRFGLYVTGTKVTYSAVRTGNNIVVVRRVGDIFTMWLNGIKILTVNKPATFIGSNYYTANSTVGIFPDIKDIGFIKTAISDLEIVGLVDSESIRSIFISNNLVSKLYIFSEYSSDTIYDIITGSEQVVVNSGGWGTLGRANNLKYGFELYTEDAGSDKIFVPLKYDGTALNPTITGYTSQGIVSQDGNEFLNCETKIKQIDTVTLPPLDTGSFWYAGAVPLEKDFASFSSSPSYVSFDAIGSNKIKNIKWSG